MNNKIIGYVALQSTHILCRDIYSIHADYEDGSRKPAKRNGYVKTEDELPLTYYGFELVKIETEII